MIVITAAADWWRSLSRTVKIIGYVGVVMGAITATATAWPTVEPWLLASRGYVRSDIHHPLLYRVITIELKQAESDRKRLLRDVQKYELELQSDQAKSTPQYHELIKKEVERTKNELDENDAKQKSLFNEKVSK